jgi:hypothetical protein
MLRFADLATDEALLLEAQRRARELVDQDPDLSSPPNPSLRRLMQERYGDRLKLYRVG